MANPKVIHVFIGYDPREDAAAQVCKYSLQKHATVPVKVHMLHLKKLEDDGILWRPREKNASTQFTYSRFLVPSLMNFQGTAVFCDCDFLWIDDVAKLVAEAKPHKGVYVVPHERYGYKPKTNTKMDGKAQTFYPKKNWSSMMVFNCGHPRVRTNLTRKHVNQESMQYLHRLEWVNKKDIGYLTPEWNWLSGYYEEIDMRPKAIHYTDGGPWFDDKDIPEEMGIDSWREVDYGELWLEYKKEWTLADKDQKREIRNVELPALTYSDAHKKYFQDLENILLDPNNIYELGSTLDQFIKDIKAHKTRGVVGVSDMEELSELLKKKGFKWDRLVDAFVKGAGGIICDWKTVLDNPKDKRPLAFRGISKRHIHQYCVENSRDYYFIDTGYFGNQGKNKLWHRITLNDLQYCGELRDVSSDRFDKAFGYTNKFKTGSKILLCPPSDKAMKFYKEDLDTWMEKTLAEIKKHTDREVVIRLKAPRKQRVYVNTIQEALNDDIHCLVTYNSIAAIEALMEGVPAIVLGQNAASSLCSNSLSKIESPYKPSEDQVYYLLCNLAYCMFTQGEILDGRAWHLLEEWYSK